MIENSEGEILVRYRYQTDKLISVIQDVYYNFKVANQISLGWVHPDHLQQVLNYKTSCITCNPFVFSLATQENLNQWLGQ